MPKIKVLLAGESWTSQSTHIKGFDHFSGAEYQTGMEGLERALAGGPVELIHMPGHLVPTRFPSTLEEMNQYDVIVLSDVGANSVLLHPDTFVRGQRTVNRLRLLADWVRGGGGFMMIGGYLTFQGINAAAAYRGTPIEKVLPVALEIGDDRVEVPEGFTPEAVLPDHPAISGIPGDWPYLLGFNRSTLRPGADLILKAGGDYDSVLLAASKQDKGRSMVWSSDIGPHWLPKQFMDWPGYAQLWTQCFMWLAGK